MENTESEFHQASTQQHPQRDTHHTDQHVGELLQAGAQRQAEGQLQQQGRQVPDPPLQALRAVSGHLHDQHQDEDGVKGPHREEDQEPVPVDFGVQLEYEHDEEDQDEDPGEENPLSQGHLHRGRSGNKPGSSGSNRT